MSEILEMEFHHFEANDNGGFDFYDEMNQEVASSEEGPLGDTVIRNSMGRDIGYIREDALGNESLFDTLQHRVAHTFEGGLGTEVHEDDGGFIGNLSDNGGHFTFQGPEGIASWQGNLLSGTVDPLTPSMSILFPHLL